MVLLAFSTMLPAFHMEVLAFSLEEAEAGVREALGLASGLSRLPKTSSLISREKRAREGGKVSGAALGCSSTWDRCRGPEALPHLQYLQELPKEPDPLRLQGYLLKG